MKQTNSHWTTNNVCRINIIAKFGRNWFYGTGSHVGEMCSYRFSGSQIPYGFSASSAYSCFVNSLTNHNSRRILTYVSSKNVVWRGGYALWLRSLYCWNALTRALFYTYPLVRTHLEVVSIVWNSLRSVYNCHQLLWDREGATKNCAICQ